MKICVFCFSDSGATLAENLCELLNLDKKSVHTTEKIALKYGFTTHKSISEGIGRLFADNDALVFIGACGIAVRTIAPYISSKTSDPAVIVIDDSGRFVIPVLSGHIGGANRLAKKIAELIGAVPVVTTATDCAGKFSCDAWAAENGCVISSMKTAKEISSAILKGTIPVCSDYELPASLPDGLENGNTGELGIYIGIHKKSPFKTTLRLIPRSLVLGIGCRRDTLKENLLSAVNSVLYANSIDIRAVGQIASIDVKKNEKGLTALAQELNAETVFFSAGELNNAEGDFAESEFVKKTVGTGNVCERAAALAGGKITVGKTALNGVTVAVAQKDWRIEF